MNFQRDSEAAYPARNNILCCTVTWLPFWSIASSTSAASVVDTTFQVDRHVFAQNLCQSKMSSCPSITIVTLLTSCLAGLSVLCFVPCRDHFPWLASTLRCRGSSNPVAPSSISTQLFTSIFQGFLVVPLRVPLVDSHRPLLRQLLVEPQYFPWCFCTQSCNRVYCFLVESTLPFDFGILPQVHHSSRNEDLFLLSEELSFSFRRIACHEHFYDEAFQRPF